jgi:hypothetical protein
VAAYGVQDPSVGWPGLQRTWQCDRSTSSFQLLPEVAASTSRPGPVGLFLRRAMHKTLNVQLFGDSQCITTPWCNMRERAAAMSGCLQASTSSAGLQLVAHPAREMASSPGAVNERGNYTHLVHPLLNSCRVAVAQAAQRPEGLRMPSATDQVYREISSTLEHGWWSVLGGQPMEQSMTPS